MSTAGTYVLRSSLTVLLVYLVQHVVQVRPMDNRRLVTGPRISPAQPARLDVYLAALVTLLCWYVRSKIASALSSRTVSLTLLLFSLVVRSSASKAVVRHQQGGLGAG